MAFFTFLATYWYLVVAAIAIIAVASIKIYIWIKTPGKDQLNKIQEWLVWAVAQAEKELGSGTGQMKMRYVYDLFISKFPAVAIFIKYDAFSAMVEKALDEFKDLLDNNRRISEEFGPEPTAYEEDQSGEMAATADPQVGGPSEDE